MNLRVRPKVENTPRRRRSVGARLRLKVALVFLGSASVVSLVVGLADSASRPPVGGTLQIGLDVERVETDPIAIATPEDGWVVAHLGGTLFRYGASSPEPRAGEASSAIGGVEKEGGRSGRVLPGLAHSLEASRDRTVYRFRLAQGGPRPTDVVRSLERLAGGVSGSPHRWLLENVKSIELERDLYRRDLTWVRLELERPDSTLAARLASLPCTISVPGGRPSGAFRPAGATEDGHLLTAAGDLRGRPYLEQLQLHVFPGSSWSLGVFDLGRVEAVLPARPEWRDHWQDDPPRVQPLWRELLYLSWNPRRTPSRSEALRRRVAEVLLPTSTWLGSWGRSEGGGLFDRYIEAGSKRTHATRTDPWPGELRLVLPRGHKRWTFYAERIQLRLRSAGIAEVKLVEMEPADYWMALEGEGYDLALRLWSPRARGSNLELRDFLGQLEIQGVPFEETLGSVRSFLNVDVLRSDEISDETLVDSLVEDGWFVPLLWQQRDLILAQNVRGRLASGPFVTVEDLWLLPEGWSGFQRDRR